ncbi:hypothetical protein SELMODRAFT_104195 [Selaginella moellendorffii]|uniref:Uncharacterized protein n=1 Tax=Selaginella moellendorffii TaxID=88036 RepID=D8RY45_SELML|nr:cytochrome P450 CYP72A219 [Selaginella moellendorffii]EFJ22839.1 hypothetical protein SELMODRAFT_104195 [Selaginella moellendorffii]|eukprot:XP_002975934.1 cytochrome P450 CYP72A219 [Selaginella moellendorffii]
MVFVIPVLATGLVGVIVYALLWKFWIAPSRKEAVLRKQGIKGPSLGPPQLFKGGNKDEVLKRRFSKRKFTLEFDGAHDILSHVLPDIHSFSKKYEMPYMYWWGNELRMTVTDPEVVRWVLSKNPQSFGKSASIQATLIKLLGYGLVASNGEHWAQHRRVVGPAFHLEKLKNIMAGTMVDCTSKVLSRWDNDGEFEIDVEKEFSFLAADVISHTAFGSSFEKGRRIFHLLNLQAELLTKIAFSPMQWMPFGRLHPLRENLQLWEVQKELDAILLGLVKDRRKSASYGRDLLGLMLEQSQDNPAFKDDKLVGECKTFYIAGQETTATLLTWAMYLLSQHREWQDRARKEVLEVCKEDEINAEALNKLKLVGMILNETLRLYPPIPIIQRGTFNDTTMGDKISIPKGIVLVIPILAMHHDKEQWGGDAHEFNPERFARGASKACKHPNAFMPFSFGPRVCIGQTFALIEAKIALAMILRRFSASLSPNYQHCPVSGVTLKPLHGMQLTFIRR